MKKIYTVAIIGTGARGADTYGKLLAKLPEKFKIVALCDLQQARLNRWSETFGVDKQNCFLDENEFFKTKRADLLVIGTQDKDHFGHAMKAFETGYDILLEKPITDRREECLALLEAQKKYNCKALVCHVLRYAPAYCKAAEIIDSGEIGKLVSIQAYEQVGYWHQAHSYVRGNWRNAEQSTPMILAKCCHDLDYLQFFAKSKCVNVSSIGDLTHFKASNAPEGSAKRCVDCKYVDTCPYSAKRIYIDRWKELSKCPTDGWPYSVIATPPLTEEKLYEAIQNGPYGRCVYHCDNTAVDHQMTNMLFENGVTASLFMTGFNALGGRRITFCGTHGELIYDGRSETLNLWKFGEQQPNVINASELSKDASGYGHGGGDFVLINTLYDMLEGQANSATSLEASIESHLMGIAAEESRKANGKLVSVH
ncbi:MAG: Gfo/Idh/MocA family oxidoreductase [Clostridia bacterium]|nr:Gfo/Idh/MocA family oxidoreductase [Clostridia bacterium]